MASDVEKAAYIFSQSVAALVKLEGMKIANAECDNRFLPPAYDEQAFYQLEKDFCIGTNDVLGFLND